MLACYSAALTAFRKAQDVLLAGILPDDPKYEEVRRVQIRAFEILARARKLYWEHVAEHNCRGTL